MLHGFVIDGNWARMASYDDGAEERRIGETVRLDMIPCTDNVVVASVSVRLLMLTVIPN